MRPEDEQYVFTELNRLRRQVDKPDHIKWVVVALFLLTLINTATNYWLVATVQLHNTVLIAVLQQIIELSVF